jgi:hypothetical protein
MIGMGVRDGDIFNVGGFEAELIELCGQRFRAPPVGHARIGGPLALGHGGDSIGHAGVPQKPALRVFDQITAIDEVHRLPHVHARRPARNVAGDSLAAIENVETLDPRFAALRTGRCRHEQSGQHRSRRETKRHAFHDVPPATLLALVRRACA